MLSMKFPAGPHFACLVRLICAREFLHVVETTSSGQKFRERFGTVYQTLQLEFRFVEFIGYFASLASAP